MVKKKKIELLRIKKEELTKILNKLETEKNLYIGEGGGTNEWKQNKKKELLQTSDMKKLITIEQIFTPEKKTIYKNILDNLLKKKKLIEFTTQLNIYNILNEYTQIKNYNRRIALESAYFYSSDPMQITSWGEGEGEEDEERRRAEEEMNSWTRSIEEHAEAALKAAGQGGGASVAEDNETGKKKNIHDIPIYFRETGNKPFSDTEENNHFELAIIIDYLFNVSRCINTRIKELEGDELQLSEEHFANIHTLGEGDFVHLSVEVMKSFKQLHNHLYKCIDSYMDTFSNNTVESKNFKIIKNIMTCYNTEFQQIKDKLDRFEETEEHIKGCQISANIIELEDFREENNKILQELPEYFDMSDYINTTIPYILTEHIEDVNDFSVDEDEQYINKLLEIDELDKLFRETFGKGV